MNYKPLSDLSIVIPTFNRQEFAKRSMHFWSGKNAIVHVMDGSSSAINFKELNLKDNINYYHLPVSLSERFKEASKLLSTKYTIMMGDDEFFLPSGLLSCINELEINKDLICCSARCVAFKIKNKKFISWKMYTEQNGYQILHDDPFQRMKYHLENYTPSTIYSVMKTEYWKQSFKAYTVKEFSAYDFPELEFELTAAFLGKSKVIPKLFWLRSFENEPIVPRSKELGIRNTFFYWWENLEKKLEVQESIELLSDCILEFLPHLDKNLLEQNIFDSLDFFHEGSKKRKLAQKEISSIEKNLKKIVPEPIKAFIKHSILKKKKIVYEFENLLEELKREGIDFEQTEIDEIVKIIKKFHKNE